MTADTLDATAQILNAASFYELFGACPAGVEPTVHVKSTYRQLARQTHPDIDKSAQAHDVFSKLADMFRLAIEACERGTYDQPQVLATVQSRKATHCIQHAWKAGDLCNTYRAESQLKNGKTLGAFCKIAQNAADNDLLKVEATTLKTLRSDTTKAVFHAYFPELLDSFSYADGSQKRQANVLDALDGFYSLAEVRQVYVDGITPLDMAWMWRRILWALSYVHDLGIVHGALLPDHILIQPQQHGVILVDWCYASVTDNGTQPALTAIVDRYRDWYPSEVFAKQTPSAATDLVMAARCMVYVMGGDPITGNFTNNRVATPFRAFFRGCMQTAQAARPQDALQLLAEFDELLERLGSPYYPRRFRPFAMPTGVA